MVIKQCVVCAAALPQRRRSDRRYCGCKCRVRAYRIREGIGKNVRPNRHHSRTALTVAAGAALGAVAAEVVRQVEPEPSQQQRELADKVAGLEERLSTVIKERDAATEAASGLRTDVQSLRLDLHRQQEQTRQTRNALIDREQQLRAKAREVESYCEEWNIAESTLAEVRAENEALRAAQIPSSRMPRSGDRTLRSQLDQAQERTRQLEGQVLTLTSQLADASRRHSALEVSSERETVLLAENKRLKHKLAAAQTDQEHLLRKIKRLKKRSSKDPHGLEEAEQPRGLLRRAAEAVGLISVGAAVGYQAQKRIKSGSAKKALPSATSKRKLPAKSED